MQAARTAYSKKLNPLQSNMILMHGSCSSIKRGCEDPLTTCRFEISQGCFTYQDRQTRTSSMSKNFSSCGIWPEPKVGGSEPRLHCFRSQIFWYFNEQSGTSMHFGPWVCYTSLSCGIFIHHTSAAVVSGLGDCMNLEQLVLTQDYSHAFIGHQIIVMPLFVIKDMMYHHLMLLHLRWQGGITLMTYLCCPRFCSLPKQSEEEDANKQNICPSRQILEELISCCFIIGSVCWSCHQNQSSWQC